MCSFVFVSAETMFKSGSLLASYIGRAAHWQSITIEYSPSGPQPEGRYVLLQQNKNQVLELHQFSASFGGTLKQTNPILFYTISNKQIYLLGSTCDNDKCVKACENGWEKHGTHCYLWVTENRNWTDAEGFCQKEGGHLASVASDETMGFVLLGAHKRGLNDVWLGGNDIAQEGEWSWTDCTPWDVDFWAPGQPSTDGHCLHYSKTVYPWNDRGCNDERGMDGFLCSKKICEVNNNEGNEGAGFQNCF